MLYPRRNQWDIAFAGSGREALQRLGESSFDILVTDVRMPEMSGAELLGEVRMHFPQTTRIVLSGAADSDLALRTATLAHQYLCKPCDAQALRSTLDRACTVRETLDDPGLRKLISGIDALPTLPAIYLELYLALRSGDVSAKDVAALIAQDMAMTAKVLQLVNSGLFGTPRNITSVADAVTYLGMETVRTLALRVMVFTQFNDPALDSFAERLSAHSLQVGALARKIAESSQFAGVTADDCFAAGLLHDIGKLILADGRPVEFQGALQDARRSGLTASQAETQLFGATHAEIGAYLLRLWGLPDCVTEAVALHHKTDGLKGGAAMAVHVADAVAHNHVNPALDINAVAEAGLTEHLPGWQQLQSEPPELRLQ
jgi:putative nucleotidyltransferase with HDIG domain